MPKQLLLTAAGRPRRPATLLLPRLLPALLGLLSPLAGRPASAQVVQKPAIFSGPGFSAALVVTGINSPTTMAFAPVSDGRIFVCQQDSSLRVVKNNALLAAPFVKLSVNADGERGLIGVALDPDFLSNHYLYRTLPDGSRNRINRFTAAGDVAKAGSETVVLDLDPLTATNHNGGAMHFGKDGKLYAAVGENTRRDSAQRATSYFGKMLRVNSDGSAPSDNPYASSQSDHARRVWSTGLRNPYTFSIEPGTGKIFVNNVGEVSWEDIDDASVGGRNFGWPTQPGGEGYTAGPGQTAPTYAYPHQAGSPDGTGGAITGGTFFTPTGTSYPAQYQGKYFFMDYCGKWINYFDPSGPDPRQSRQPFAQQVGNGDGLWSAQPTVLTLIITPPWWKTRWFRALATLLVLGGATAFYRLRTNALRKKLHLEKLLELRTKEAELREARLRHEKELAELKRMQLETEVLHKNSELASSVMNVVHQNGTQRLKKAHPQLTGRDLKLGAYLRMNLDSKEMASLMGLSVRGIEDLRYRVRKKMRLDTTTNLAEFILLL